MSTWPSDDPAAERHWNLGSGGPVSAGTVVNEDTAYNYSAFWAIIQVYATAIASLPLQVYKRRRDGGKTVDRKHPYYRLLHDQFNPTMTSYTAREVLQAHLLTWGNAYCFIERESPGGRAVALWPMDPSRIELKRTVNTGELYYEFRPPTGAVQFYNTSQIFHLRNISFNGLVGMGIVAVARESIGTGLATDKYQGTFYGNAAVPTGALEIPAVLKAETLERVKKSLKEEHVDWENKRRPMILEGGSTWRSIATNHHDAEFIASRRFGVEEMARFGNIPVHFLREMTNSSVRANIEQESLDAVLYSFRPVAVRWEQEFSRQLFLDRERDTRFAEFNFDGLLRGDAATRADVYFKGMQTGRYSVNDILRRENQNPVGSEGDRRFVPMNLMPLDSVDKEPEPEPAPEPADDDDETPDEAETEDKAMDRTPHTPHIADARLRITANFERLFVDAFGRLLSKEVLAIKQEAKKHLPGDGERFRARLAEFYKGHTAYARAALAPLVASLLDSIDDAGQVPDASHRFVEDYAQTAGIRHTVNSQTAVLDVMDRTGQAEWLDAVTKQVDEWASWRATAHGRHEVYQASEAIAEFIKEADDGQ